MQFGACIPHYGDAASAKGIADFSRLAEELNFDSIWTTDHIAVSKRFTVPYGKIYESLLTLDYAAAKTERVKLGTSIIVLPMRNPILFAKQTATLDQLSGGRLILGLGAGWMHDEFATLGFDFQKRGRIMDEQIRLLRVLWTGESAKFEGRFFRFNEIAFEPTAAQRGGPHVWIGGSSDAALRRVSSLGDGWHPVGLSPKELSEGKKKLDSILNQGRKVTITVRVPVAISSSGTTSYSLSSGEQAYMIGGTRETVVQEIEAFKRSGLDHLVCYFGNEPYDKIASQATLFAKEIIPSFSD
jgi:probable F420-dependent oxidoreductase